MKTDVRMGFALPPGETDGKAGGLRSSLGAPWTAEVDIPLVTSIWGMKA